MIKTIEKEYGKAESSKFEFITTSYVLPQEHALFQEEFKRNPGSIWIMKPVGILLSFLDRRSCSRERNISDKQAQSDLAMEKRSTTWRNAI